MCNLFFILELWLYSCMCCVCIYIYVWCVFVNAWRACLYVNMFVICVYSTSMSHPTQACIYLLNHAVFISCAVSRSFDVAVAIRCPVKGSVSPRLPRHPSSATSPGLLSIARLHRPPEGRLSALPFLIQALHQSRRKNELQHVKHQVGGLVIDSQICFSDIV